MTILRLAIPSPLRRLFDYLPPDGTEADDLQPGMRFKVTFGRRETIGLLVEITSSSEIPANKLKPARELLDATPVLPPTIMELARWAAGYYHHPEGDALHQALPVALRHGDPCDYRHSWFWHADKEASLECLPGNAHRQRSLLEVLLAHPQGISQEALKAEGFDPAPLKNLLNKGLAHREQHNPYALSAQPEILRQPALPLNQEQQSALTGITAHAGFQTNLLDGVTGSGKTEVYLQAIAHCLHQGKQALVLVPEIGLTPQTIARFKARFNVPIAALHSGLTDRQRLDGWLAAKDGHARIIIGTRSAIFTPMAAPGMLIIDEEHDTSFKQQEGFRYSARDLAVYRGRLENIPVILGSATPALESLHNALEGRYHWLKLTERAGHSLPPAFELLDIRQQPLTDGLSEPLIARIRHHLHQGTQVLVFLNRRGYAPSLMCHDCGWIADCSRCDAHLTLHRQPPRLHCHHCDTQQPVPHHCPQCQSTEIMPMGAGTERTEQTLQSLFPNTPVLRVDRDSTQRKNAMHQITEQVATGKPCILLGTQMLAKGHHFPRVTLVAIINADGGLFSADFRGMERTAQLILQVAGRAGRADHPGQVVMQTHHADHPMLQSLVSQGYDAFATLELQHRHLANLPPYHHYAILRAEATQRGRADAFLSALRQQFTSHLQTSHACQWLGPFPSPMEKRGGLFRAQLMLHAADRKPLHQLLQQLCSFLEQHPEARKVRWSIDVDPADTF
ncbi:primosomal protein N' [Neptuniibacter sp. CAU 1671]|uniref:primosomal protein N' n=1 Tax=Neptuniibacter sp. CAU 1671 TaxID=3032593 RepID=UPI0023D9B4CE|nr:primosomal protein N' [Neptuniibacter sp. CAU 1671]MDF2181649.1 primosomal protein N' [Neptuniibacter sp. CAU 1671]